MPCRPFQPSLILAGKARADQLRYALICLGDFFYSIDPDAKFSQHFTCVIYFCSARVQGTDIALIVTTVSYDHKIIITSIPEANVIDNLYV